MFIFFAILGIILTALPYMIVPILYRKAEGQIKYKNAMYFALVNSIVVSILLNIIGAGLAFSSGVAVLFTVNLAPPVIYFFINKAILNMRSSRCNSYQSFLNSKEYYKTEKRLKKFFQSYDFLKSRSDNISGHGLAHRSFNYLKSIEQNLSEDQYVFVQTMALEKHFSLYKRLTAYNTVYDADLIQVFIEESKPHVAKTVEDISEYLTERMSENDSGEPTGIAIDMETYKKLKSVFEENILYFSEIDKGKHLFKLFKIQLESEKKTDEEQQTAAEESEADNKEKNQKNEKEPPQIDEATISKEETINQILSKFEDDLKPLKQELNFEPILEKFDNALDKIFCKEICDIIFDDIVDLENSNIQHLSKVVWKCLNDFAREIILSHVAVGFDTEESDAIIINLRCILLKKLCELNNQDDSRSMCAWDFCMENQEKLRKIFIDCVEFLKEKVPLQIDEYGNVENILTDNYYYAHLFYLIDDLLYEKNLDTILDEYKEFDLFEIWGMYILKWDNGN